VFKKMNFFQKYLATLLLLSVWLAAPIARAQSLNEKQVQQPIPSASNFLGIGAGAFPKTSGSSELRTMVLPVVQYNWGNIAYISGLKAGLWGFTTEDRSLRIGLYAEPRFGYDASDSKRTVGMADREFAIDAGPSLRWTTPLGALNLEYGFDVTGRSNGQAAQIQFIRPLISEQGLRLNALAGATWQNAAMNSYYWGKRASESGTGSAINIGAGTAFSVGLTGFYKMSYGGGALFFGTSINRLSDPQAQSPISERRYTPVIYLGYGWQL
jgi:outer membrane protein